MLKVTPERLLVFAVSLALAAYVAVTAVNFVSAAFAKIDNAFEQTQKGGE